jgi:hypothetical protein
MSPLPELWLQFGAMAERRKVQVFRRKIGAVGPDDCFKFFVHARSALTAD